MYTVPFTTTGAAAKEPAYSRLFAALPVSLNVHASFSRETFADEICPAASLVLARFPLGYAHDPAGRAAPVSTLVVPVGCGGELHPEATRAAALAMVSMRPYPATRCLIKTTLYSLKLLGLPAAVNRDRVERPL
jgi:hypothetical protein